MTTYDSTQPPDRNYARPLMGHVRSLEGII
jgi:hypothetical protein